MTPSAFYGIAQQALEAYGLQGWPVRHIRHSDNVTFQVGDPPSDAFLLRIHVPITAAMGTHGTDPDAVTSELLWLEALCRDTDLILQEPVRNRAGALVTPVPSGGAHKTVNCSVLRWLDGQPYHRDLESAETAWQIGHIMATLHRHASQWEVPSGFKRPRRDVAYFEKVLRGIRPALEDGRIRVSDYDALERSIALLTDMMRSQEETRQTAGIMHADAHKGNMLYHHGEVRLIDFSFCAFGHFMFDLGVCLSDMKEPLHRAFLQAYRRLRPLPQGHQRLIEGFFVGSMVGTFSYWVPNPHAQETLARKVPQIARDYAARFNRGESFWVL